MDLNTLWFVILGFLIAGYAILDGFDLGVGILTLFSRDEEQRRVYLNAIGPVWDGNEVWLVIFGATLFAAFPPVYAAVFSALYTPVMLLLVALIFRAVSLEFRGHVAHRAWRRFWDSGFGLGSLGVALLLGMALGNVMCGLPLADGGAAEFTLKSAFRPFPVLLGIYSTLFFAAHGAIYAATKTEGPRQERLANLALTLGRCSALPALALVAVGMKALRLPAPDSRTDFWRIALVAMLAALVFGAGFAWESFIKARRLAGAFICSSVAIALIIAAFGAVFYPAIVPSSLDPAASLTIYNAASSPLTLKVMLVVVALGMPVVIAYTAYVYHLFSGKVRLSEEGY